MFSIFLEKSPPQSSSITIAVCDKLWLNMEKRLYFLECLDLDAVPVAGYNEAVIDVRGALPEFLPWILSRRSAVMNNSSQIDRSYSLMKMQHLGKIPLETIGSMDKGYFCAL